LFKLFRSKIVKIVLPLFFILQVVTVNAGLFGKSESQDPRLVDEVFTLSSEILPNNQLLLRWDILDAYYLYDNKMKFTIADKDVVEVSRSKSKLKEDPLFGKVNVYYHSSEIVLNIEQYKQQGFIDLRVQYQGCWDGGVCYPPVSKMLNIALPAQSEVADNTVDPVVGATENSAVLSEQDYFSVLLSEGSLAWIMGVFFVAGLALSLTPCVLPMIPIISSIIVGQGKQVTRGKAFSLTLVYVLSVAITYTVAGVLAGMFGENLQALLQATWIIVVFSIVFVLLSLSMFGFYELQLPAVLQSKLTSMSNNQRTGNYIGVAIMGVLSALIVGPCMAAPLAGALIYIAQSADPVLGGLALFSLSIGMGVPLLLVGVSAGHFLPKVGAWMTRIKAAFGVVLIFMAIYMLDRVVSIEITQLLSAITIIISAIFIGAFAPLKEKDNALAKLFKGIGLVFLVYGLSLLIGVFVGNARFVQPLQGLSITNNVQHGSNNSFTKVTALAQITPILAQAKAENVPVMLDFYADWCISCVELELMFEEEAVAKKLSKMRLIKVDLTDFNDDARALLKKYQVLGPPALVFYDAKGELMSHMQTVGLLSADKFLKHIEPLTAVQ